ncbi:MAG: biotin--[acetyl-CoA-carboxylase] ligase [Firmicutes bacterium]|nr:biotin--[acetyl-CoA-carboxylase] ligase [Bacillota bacterium]
MSIKQSVLELFEENENVYLSGEEIAKKLFVSRNAVWKAVRDLKEDGYDISAVTNKGYCMNSNSGILSKQSVEKNLDKSRFDVNVYKVVDSTNTLAKELAEKGAKEGTVVIAEEQTAGKGRMGRIFYSPKGTGLYMSIVLRPGIRADEAVCITAMAAVCVAESIESVCDNKAEIKWVNDVYCNRKKVCGILTQGAVNFESGFFDYAIVGIGINVAEPPEGFPESISDIAGAVFKSINLKSDIKSVLAAEILNRFILYYDSFDKKTFLDEYKRRSFLIGEDILVVRANEMIPAKAVQITDNCGLVVEYENKTSEILTSGEVSIKIGRNK